MVKLRVAARVIPENNYLASLDTPSNAPIRGERRFPVIVRDPEEWYIGRLALEIKAAYARLYKHDLGAIKYIKDAEDDCDLDPESLVSDLLVDEGSAALNGADQKVTVKVIQEQGRAIREGSVIPDLTSAHFQPISKPPVPRFPAVPTSLGKRAAHERPGSVNGTSGKRVRLGEISEIGENEDVLRSIEDDAVRESPEITIQDSQLVYASIPSAFQTNGEPKTESPELSTSWRHFPTATRDELELLSGAPQDLAKNSSKEPESAGKTIQKTSSPAVQRHLVTPQKGLAHDANHLDTELDVHHSKPNESTQQQPLLDSEAPSTPLYDAAHTLTGSGKAVSTLNSLKRRSPANENAPESSRRFTSSTRDVYAYPESDIEDSQMSPRSLAAATITPKLIPSAKKTRATRGTRSPTDDRSRRSNVSDLMTDVKSGKVSPANNSEHVESQENTKVPNGKAMKKRRQRRTRSSGENGDTPSTQSIDSISVTQEGTLIPKQALPTEQTQLALPLWGSGIQDVGKSDMTKNENTLHERTAEDSSLTAARKVTLPPGMTQEEYDGILQSRADMTAEKRQAEKEAWRLKNSSSATRKTPSRSSEAPVSKAAAQSKTEATIASNRATKSPSVALPERTAVSNRNTSTPKSATKALVENSSTTKKSNTLSSSATKVPIQASSTTNKPSLSSSVTATPTSTKKMAPPTHLTSSVTKPPPKSALKNPTAAATDISQVRSLQTLRTVLNSSASSSPAPGKPGFATAVAAKDKSRRISFKDELSSSDEDSNASSESESDSNPAGDIDKAGEPAVPALKKKKRAKPTVAVRSARRPDPSIRDATPADSDEDEDE